MARLGLAFVTLPKGVSGAPILRVLVKAPLGGGQQYPKPFTDGIFLTNAEYHPDQLEAQVKQLHAELDEIVKEAYRRYKRWGKMIWKTPRAENESLPENV